MSDPYTEQDIEVHFIHGEPLFVSGMRHDLGDRCWESGDRLHIVRRLEDGANVAHNLRLEAIAGVQTTTRTVTPEPKTPGLE